MAEIEHDIAGDEDAEVEIGEYFGYGFYVDLKGNGTAIRCYLGHDHLESLAAQLKEWGVGET